MYVFGPSPPDAGANANDRTGSPAVHDGTYVAQATSAERFIARRAEHAHANPDAGFEFEILGRTAPGTELDRLDEYWIRKLGGPTTGANPAGLLANARHQMSEPRYWAAGGSPFP